MAIKATIHKATLQIADMDRQVYATHALTLARQPSETDERLMMRLLAFALNVPADDLDGRLEPALGMADADEPDLWHRSLSGELRHWIEVGQPDERRLVRACGRAARVTLYCYSPAATIWWTGVQGKLARLDALAVWRVPATQSQALAGLAARTMTLQFTVQDGSVWVGDGSVEPVEIQPELLRPARS
jgi:uncharacterized protein YaeQ